MINKPTAYINDWVVINSRLFGTITQHPTQEIFRGDIQQTSRLVYIDKIKGIAETQNTTYYLLNELTIPSTP